MCTAKTLIRLGVCPGWSDSSLGAHTILLVLSWGSSNVKKVSNAAYYFNDYFYHDIYFSWSLDLMYISRSFNFAQPSGKWNHFIVKSCHFPYNSSILLDISRNFNQGICCWVSNILYDLSHNMTKPTKWLCAQGRLRSASASAQSDQSLLCT